MTYDYGGGVVHPYLGRVVLKKLNGSGAVSVGTQVVVPHAAAMPRNPVNNSYYTGVNSSGFTSGNNEGKKTPSCTITTLAKASFLTANNINSLIMTLDGVGDTDTWAILLDDLYNPLVYDGCKCASIQFRQQSMGGPIAISLAFLAQYGDSENPGTNYALTTFSSTSIQAGQVMDVTQVQYAGTATNVFSLAIDLVRPQGYVMYDDGTRWAAGIASGMFGGDVTISQSTKYTATFGTSATINIGTAGNGISCAGLTFLNELIQDLTMAPRTAVQQFSLYDSVSGGNPFVITAL